MVERLIGLLVNRRVGSAFAHLRAFVPRFSLGMVSVSRTLFIRGSKAWRFVREVSGEADYEGYRARHAAGAALLSPGEFYQQTLERKYSRPCRCC